MSLTIRTTNLGVFGAADVYMNIPGIPYRLEKCTPHTLWDTLYVMTRSGLIAEIWTKLLIRVSYSVRN